MSEQNQLEETQQSAAPAEQTWWDGVELWWSTSKVKKLIWQIIKFFIFSMGVTILQAVIMIFLPRAFEGLGTESWGWPGVPLSIAGDVPYIIFGDSNGLGYFIAFEIATFLAQCVNFPLQRNITFRSKGSIPWQIMWYFIGWVAISVFVNALWGFINCFLTHWGWYDGAILEVLAGLLKTFITGGISMIVFFPIFKIIFPEGEAKPKA